MSAERYYWRADRQLTVVGFLDVDPVLAEGEGQVVHRQDDPVAVDTRRRATATSSGAVDAQLGKVERVTRQVGDELLRREREEALSVCQLDGKAKS